MALTRSYPGVIRFRKALWLANPNIGDVSALKRRRRRDGSERLASYAVVVVVFAPVILLEIFATDDFKKSVVPWVSIFDVDRIFTGLTVVVALLILAGVAWLAYGRANHDPEVTRQQVVSLGVFETVGANVTDSMSWDALWRLAVSLERLDEEHLAEFEAGQAKDESAARRSRRIVREQLVEATRAAEALGLTVDLSYYADSDDPAHNAHP